MGSPQLGLHGPRRAGPGASRRRGLARIRPAPPPAGLPPRTVARRPARPGRERGSPPGSVSVLLQLLSRILRWRRLSPAQALSGVSVPNSGVYSLSRGNFHIRPRAPLEDPCPRLHPNSSSRSVSFFCLVCVWCIRFLHNRGGWSIYS